MKVSDWIVTGDMEMIVLSHMDCIGRDFDE